MGNDGHYIADGFEKTVVIESQSGWGDLIRDRIRNGDWNYQIFDAIGKPPAAGKEINQAECMACHLPKADDSFILSLKELTESALK
jgi:hypothetical protein